MLQDKDKYLSIGRDSTLRLWQCGTLALTKTITLPVRAHARVLACRRCAMHAFDAHGPPQRTRRCAGWLEWQLHCGRHRVAARTRSADGRFRVDGAQRNLPFGGGSAQKPRRARDPGRQTDSRLRRSLRGLLDIRWPRTLSFYLL